MTKIKFILIIVLFCQCAKLKQRIIKSETLVNNGYYYYAKKIIKDSLEQGILNLRLQQISSVMDKKERITFMLTSSIPIKKGLFSLPSISKKKYLPKPLKEYKKIIFLDKYNSDRDGGTFSYLYAPKEEIIFQYSSNSHNGAWEYHSGILDEANEIREVKAEIKKVIKNRKKIAPKEPTMLTTIEKIGTNKWEVKVELMFSSDKK